MFTIFEKNNRKISEQSGFSFLSAYSSKIRNLSLEWETRTKRWILIFLERREIMFWIIRVLCRLLLGIWRMFWRLVWTLVVLILIALGILWYMTGDLSGVFNQAGQLVQVGQAGWHQWQETGKLQGLSQTDHHQDSGVKWPQAQATIYIDPQMDATFQKAYAEAIANWNQTGAFNFVVVTEPDQATIFATEMNDGSTSVAGEAESQTNLLTKQFTSVTVRLNHYYLSNPNYGYTYDRILHTAEHELGHAIGLEHTNEVSVMQPAGSYYGIQAQDVQAVQELYESGE